jgi:hypothetical protein
LCLLSPTVPGSSMAAMVAIALAVVAGAGAGQRAGRWRGALTAGMVAALLVVVSVDAVLPRRGWVISSAPPSAGGHRLVDPIAILLISALCAVVMWVSAVPGRLAGRELRR